jgi:hypothetical protein
MSVALRAFVSLIVFGIAVGAAWAGSEKKLIQIGWDIPSTSYLRQHWQKMDKGTPFNGVIFKVEGAGWSSEAVWDRQPWDRGRLISAVEDLKACHFTTLTSNFLRVNATPGDLDWFDDAGWAALSEKVGLLAWVAKEGRAAGLCLDFESYGKRQFQYQPTPAHSFLETRDAARRRGAQVMRCLAREYPDATLLAFWLDSVALPAGEATDPLAMLPADGYGLLPAFIDGLLDAAPPRMTLVDGCENAYLFDSETEYLRAYQRISGREGPAARLVSPENRAKYRRQVQVGFGFYLDAYINPETSQWHIDMHGQPRLSRLARNLALARRIADEYVWVYGEQYRWWPDAAGSVGKRWDDALPGLTQTIAFVQDPTEAARREVEARRQAGSLQNLLTNPGFDGSPGAQGLPEGWTSWQDDASHGTFTFDPAVGLGRQGSAKAEGVAAGCYVQRVRVQPGQRFLVESDVLPQGTTSYHIMVRWQDPESKWTSVDRDVTIAFGPAGQGGWRHATGAVEVPEGAGYLVLLLGVGAQASAQDACWFDNAGVYISQSTPVAGGQ